ncbi:hypothetical protein B0H13DRAFT_1909049 [Mycena leptocephala]|nr:hypothetical protein B0H13DRAFT_1909049 [Mycena leptocephala]
MLFLFLLSWLLLLASCPSFTALHPKLPQQDSESCLTSASASCFSPNKAVAAARAPWSFPLPLPHLLVSVGIPSNVIFISPHLFASPHPPRIVIILVWQNEKHTAREWERERESSGVASNSDSALVLCCMYIGEHRSDGDDGDQYRYRRETH